jgi:hypothetical protein
MAFLDLTSSDCRRWDDGHVTNAAESLDHVNYILLWDQNLQNDNNLLASLYRWAHRQDENFTTEAFAHLVKTLLQCEPLAGIELILYLSKNRLAIPMEHAPFVEVTCQTDTDFGRPDLEIRAPGHLLYVEVKDCAAIGCQQLGRYRQALIKSGVAETTLVLLTRHPPEFLDGERADVERRWYEVADHLSEAMSRRPWASHEAALTAKQFVEYLRIRGMTMDRVTWELKNGVRAARNLIDMLREVLLGVVGSKITKTTGWEWVGFYIQDKKAWLGIYWESPTLLRFSTENITFSLERAADIGYGQVEEHKWTPDGRRWFYEIDLESEEEHFFARSRANQMLRLEAFVRKGFAALAELESSSLQSAQGGE